MKNAAALAVLLAGCSPQHWVLILNFSGDHLRAMGEFDSQSQCVAKGQKAMAEHPFITTYACVIGHDVSLTYSQGAGEKNGT